ncbi:MAG: OmpP1/FadL family transporter [Archangium sp.]
MKKTLTVMTLLAAGASQAAGLAIDTQSARATGMGSTGVANSRDASSIYYNPAGILGVNQLDAQLGDALILTDLSFTPEGGTTQSQLTPSPPPHAYFVYKFHPQVAAGVGVFTPYGANSKWPDDFVGRFINQSSKLQTFDINPTVGFAPVEQVRLGAGLQVEYGSVNIQRQLSPLLPGASVKLAGNGWGVGYNVGAQVDVLKNLLTLGAHFRSQVKIVFDGDATFRDVPPPAAPLFPPDQAIRSTIRLPAELGLGVSVTPLPRLTLAAQTDWYQWSTIKEIAIEFQQTPQANTSQPKNWKNTWNLHLGGEYGVTDALHVRAGLIYDPTPTPEDTLTPDLPDATRWNITVGAGYAFSSFKVDLAYQLVLLQDQRSTFPQLPGTYSGTAHVIALTLGYAR